jgi:uncharacterized protein
MIRSVSRFAGTALALAMLAGPALAQQAAPQAPQAAQPSATQLALAREVALGSGMTRSFDSITDQMLEQMSQMNVTRPEIKQDLDQVIEILRPEMEQQKQLMVTAAARVFANRLSEQELKDVAAFFKSPSGLKYVQSQPVVLDDIVKEIATWTQNVSEYILIRARAEMKKRGHELQ